MQNTPEQIQPKHTAMNRQKEIKLQHREIIDHNGPEQSITEQLFIESTGMDQNKT